MLCCSQIQSLFREDYGEVYVLRVPTQQERTSFFQDLILNQAAEAPPSKRKTCVCDSAFMLWLLSPECDRSLTLSSSSSLSISGNGGPPPSSTAASSQNVGARAPPPGGAGGGRAARAPSLPAKHHRAPVSGPPLQSLHQTGRHRGGESLRERHADICRSVLRS